MRIRILEISDNLSKAVPTPECYGVYEFQTIIDRDKSEYKALACAELSYVYHMNDYESPYYKYEESVREFKIVEDFLPEGWIPDIQVQDAAIKYRQLIKSELALLLDSAEVGLHKLRSYFDGVDLLATDDKNRPVYSSRDLIANLSALGKVTQSIQDLKEQLARYEGEGNRNKKGVETNKFSE